MGRTPIALAMIALAAASCTSGTSTPRTQPPPTSSTTASGTATPTPTASTTSTATPARAEWPTYHGTNDRAGFADVDALAPPLTLAWRNRLDGPVYAQPIVAAGHVIAATENNTLYAFDPATGDTAWARHLVAPIRASALPCGNIDPSGITGTPAYDAKTGLLFTVTESAGARHVLWGVDARTGKARWQRSVDLAGGRDPKAQQERGAVLVTGGRVVVAFGGRFGDCGNYVGYVVSIATDGAGPARVYAVPTAREAGIWAAPGPVVGPGGDIYVASGNGAETGGHYDGSDSVIRLSSTLHRKAFFAPSTWPEDNAQDLDLGSMSPVIVGNRVLIAGKRGTVYLLGANLGGIGGQVASIQRCAGFGGAAVSGGTVYLPCANGVRALLVSTSGRMRWSWGPVFGLLSPVAARGVVYALDDQEQGRGTLVELDARTGHRRGSVALGSMVTRFATPVPFERYVFVGTVSGLVAVAGSS